MEQIAPIDFEQELNTRIPRCRFFINKEDYLLRKRTKSYEFYLPQVRTERDAKPLSKEQIESAGRVAMRLICDALESHPDLRTQVKDYTKLNAKNNSNKIKDKRPPNTFNSIGVKTQITNAHNRRVNLPIIIETVNHSICQ